MNDAYRGALIVGALTALYFAVRLAVVQVGAWRKRRRDPGHHGRHALWMTLGLLLTAGLLAERMAAQAGTNAPLEWRDLLRAVQVVSIIAGLLALWSHHQAAVRDRQRNPSPDPEKKESDV